MLCAYIEVRISGKGHTVTAEATHECIHALNVHFPPPRYFIFPCSFYTRSGLTPLRDCLARPWPYRRASAAARQWRARRDCARGGRSCWLLAGRQIEVMPCV